jgi:hypothetical protein
MTSDPQAAAAPAYDTPWKIAVEQYFEQFMAFYFPRTFAQIDWAAKYEFLDKELFAVTKTALVGTRHVDKLVRVRRLSGQEDWIYIHLEVQVSRQRDFARRMYIYNYRIFDRYNKPVASMAVLGDDHLRWLPQQYGHEVFDCELGFRFPIAKLASYAGQEAALEADANPFALLTLAHLHTRATRRDMNGRYALKCKLIRLLHTHQWDKEMIRQFFRVIDWLMALPPELETKLDDFIVELEEGQKMEYVTSIERVRSARNRQEGLQEGLQVGKAELLSRLLTGRFGDLPASVEERIQSATIAQIDGWFDCGLVAKSLDEVFLDLPH